MDCKGIGLVSLLASLAPLANAEEAKTELICGGSFGFLSSDGKWTNSDIEGVYFGLFDEVVRIAGGPLSFKDNYFIIQTENPSEITFSMNEIDGSINRHSGRLSAIAVEGGSNKILFTLDLRCSKPKPLF
jgi:hypothetical protein